jgi:hypothetical protein
MIQQMNDQLLYTTEAGESSDVKHAAKLAVHFCGCNSSRDHYNGLLEKVTEKKFDSEIHSFHFTTHQETQCYKIIRLWHIFKKVPPIGNFIRTLGLCTDISFLFFFTLAVNMKICNITLKFQPQCVKGVI